MKINIRKDIMTKDERWIALLNRQPLDRIPVFGFGMGFFTIHCGFTIADAYNNPEKLFNSVIHTIAKFGWQDLPLIVQAGLGAWEFGGDIKWPTDECEQAPKVTPKPVKTKEDIDRLEVPDIKTAGIIPLMMEVAKFQERTGAPHIAVMTLGPWSVACNICGLNTVLEWIYINPELLHRVQQKVLLFSTGLLQYWVDTFGANHIFPWILGSAAASNQLMSPKHVEEFVLPYMRELYKEAHAMGIKHIHFHICGKQELNLPYWSQLNFGNPGIISFGHEVDLEKAAKYFPNDIIMGNVETAVIQLESPENVYELTRKTIEKGKNCPGGFILAPACEMPPRAPEENVWAMMQAVSDYGWYE